MNDISARQLAEHVLGGTPPRTFVLSDMSAKQIAEHLRGLGKQATQADVAAFFRVMDALGEAPRVKAVYGRTIVYDGSWLGERFPGLQS